jgi:8-oxo-dGTP pyrophosphatase MutT (NUDIX family)
MESKKILYDNEWLSLIDSDGYIYSHEVKGDGKKVAILVVDSQNPGKVLGRYENTPAHGDGIQLASITGTVEDDDPLSTAVMETDEEAGFFVDEDELIELGIVRPSKSADTTCYLYAVDVAGKTQHEPEGDGSSGEQGAYVKWISAQDAVECKDPLMSVMLMRYALMQEK